jgi:DNA-binding PadR family transcriptional regulator
MAKGLRVIKQRAVTCDGKSAPAASSIAVVEDATSLGFGGDQHDSYLKCKTYRENVLFPFSVFALFVLSKGPTWGRSLMVQWNHLMRDDRGEPAIYGALFHLQHRGLVQSRWQLHRESGHRGGNRRIYSITPLGKKMLAKYVHGVRVAMQQMRKGQS